MPHMPATGVNGLDLYVRADDGTWRWLAVGWPRGPANEEILVGNLPKKKRQYLLYLNDLLHGNFGPSYIMPDFTVADLFRVGLPVT